MERNDQYDFFWLCYGKKGNTKVFRGEKRPSQDWMTHNGIEKIRAIEAPDADLQKEQTAAVRSLFDLNMGPSPFAHAYVFGRSIKTNAAPHVGKAYMVKVDIKECYDNVQPRIVIPRIKAIFARHGLPWSEETEFGLLHTLFLRTKRLKHEDGSPRWHLPTGAPSSPFLLNIGLWNFDWRMHRFIAKWRRSFKAPKAFAQLAEAAAGPVAHPQDSAKLIASIMAPMMADIEYTRYSDNITISSDDARIVQLIPVIKYFLEMEGLRLHPKKTQFLTPKHPHRVCGVMTNDKITAGKRRYRRLRSAMYRYRRDITAGKVPAGYFLTKDDKKLPIDMLRLRGELEFVAFCDAVQGAGLRTSFFQLQDLCLQNQTVAATSPLA